MTIADLSQNFAHVTDRLSSLGDISYVDFPVHKNIGDVLIFLGTMELFRRERTDITRTICTLDVSARHLDAVAKAKAFICHGGGNLGDIYARPQALREAVIGRSHGAPGFIFPQSIQFKDENRLKGAARIFKAHPKLTIFTRDKPSFDLAREHLCEDVILSQDMAHTLYDWLAPIRAERPRKETGDLETLHFIRRDLEVGQHQENFSSGGGHADGPLDWSDLLTVKDKLQFEAYRRVAMSSTLLPHLPLRFLYSYEAFCRDVVIRMARRFIQYDHVVTSRLHGAIFSLLLDRQVTIIDNSYGKNSRYADQWLSDVPHLDIGVRADVKSAGL